LKLNKIDQQVVPMLGPSGCGKTFTVYEFLSRNWGFYIPADLQRNGGSRILEGIITTFATLDGSNPLGNRQLAVASFLPMLSAFLLVQTQCISLDWTPFQFMLLQIYPLHVGAALTDSLKMELGVSTSDDLFQTLWNALRDVPLKDVIEHCRAAQNIKLFVDEAQVMCAFEVFPPHLGNDGLRSLLSGFLHCFLRADQQIDAQIFLAGVSFDLMASQSEVTSFIAKSPDETVLFVEYACFGADEKTKSFAQLLVPSISNLEFNSAITLLRGRARFFMNYLLDRVDGVSHEDSLRQSWSKITESSGVTYSTKGNSPHSIADVLTILNQSHPTIQDGVNILEMVKDVLALVALRGSYQFVSQREFELMTYGFAHVTSDLDGTLRGSVDEPAVLHGASDWFLKQNAAIESRTLRLLALVQSFSPGGAGDVWEVVLCPDLLQNFPNLVRPLFPSASNIRVEQVAVQGIPVLARDERHGSFSSWLTGPFSTFYKPSNEAGPDISFFLLVDSERYLVNLQAKLRRKFEHVKAWSTVDPTQFYKHKGENRTCRLQQLFEDVKHALLPFRNSDELDGQLQPDRIIRCLCAFPYENKTNKAAAEVVVVRSGRSATKPFFRVVIDASNAAKVFSKDHLGLLSKLRPN
jgi:hypothetical protein